MTTNPSPPDWRGLCEELLEALDGWHKAVFETGTGWVRPDETYLIDRARAALAAEAVAEGPTDEEVEAWADRQGFIRGSGDHPCGFWIDDGDAGAFARAVLARFGHQPEPPAEGEVGELVEFLRIYGDEVMDEYGDVGEHDQLTRAADLLEQRHPAPVPVSERLPGDALCWWYEPDEDDDGSGYGGNWTLLRIRGAVSCYTHWLPATALPLPAGEVQP